MKLSSWASLPPSSRLVVISLSVFSLLQVADFFLKHGKGIYYLPLNFLLILIFFWQPGLAGRWPQHSTAYFILRVLPLAGYAYCYKLAGSLVHLIHDGWFDGKIAAADRWLFGFQPNLAVGRYFNPWLSEIMLLAYVIYLPLVVILGYLIYGQGSHELLEKYLLALGLAYLVCFIIFILLPAASPRFYFSGNQPDSGFFFRRLMSLAERSVQYAGGSFPSAHCAAGTVMIFYAGKLGRKYFAIYLPLVLLFFISTVYGQYHYVVDIASGVAVGLGAAAVTDRFKIKSA